MNNGKRQSAAKCSEGCRISREQNNDDKYRGRTSFSFKAHTRIANIIVWHIETWYVFEINVNKTGRVLLGLRRLRENS